MSTFMSRLRGKLLGLGGGVLLLMATGVGHAGTVTYVYTDPQGTPLMETDAHGNITATFDYAPYGSIALGTAPNGPGYTGHVNDPDTGLVYMQARYYDPSVGRFLSTDPMEPSAGNAFNFNRYAYVNNNPIGNTDPTGMAPGDSDECEHTAYSCQKTTFASGAGGGGSSGSQSGGGSAPSTSHAPGCDGSAECDEVKGTAYQLMRDQAEAEKKAGIFGVNFIAINFLSDGLGKIFGNVAEFISLRGLATGADLIKADATGSALKMDYFHYAATFYREDAAASGTRFRSVGGDGTVRTLFQMKGELQGVNGRYEYLINARGQLTHQVFVPHGSINGLINTP